MENSHHYNYLLSTTHAMITECHLGPQVFYAFSFTAGGLGREPCPGDRGGYVDTPTIRVLTHLRIGEW